MPIDNAQTKAHCYRVSNRKVEPMTEYTVHFQKGVRLHMVTVGAPAVLQARVLAFQELRERTRDRTQGYKVTRIDHFEHGRLVRDMG
jgi:hypothetical protein